MMKQSEATGNICMMKMTVGAFPKAQLMFFLLFPSSPMIVQTFPRSPVGYKENGWLVSSAVQQLLEVLPRLTVRRFA